MSTIAFLGIGTMGLPMARNLAQAGYSIRAWNRTVDRADPLKQHGATVCQTPAEAARGASVVITMLADADAVSEAAGDALRELDADGTWIQMSTIGIDGTERCAELAQTAKVTFVDAPVLGSAEPAQQGRLVVLASGDSETIDACEPIFDAIAGKVVRCGDAGAGTRIKLVANNWLLSLTAALGESINLARGLDVDPQAFLDAIKDGSVDSPYAHIKGKLMIPGNYDEVAFKLDLARKDAGLALTAARGAGVSMPVLEATLGRIERASKDGHGDQDMSAMALGDQRRQQVGSES